MAYGKMIARLMLLSCGLLTSVCALSVMAQPRIRIGFVDPSLPNEPPHRNAAALEFARTEGIVSRLLPTAGGAWQDEAGRLRAPEEFDVVWYHQGDDVGAVVLNEAARADLLDYVDGGGALLLSGAAGELVNGMGVESTPCRVLAPTDAAFVTGFIVREKYRTHPAFAGFDTSRPVLVTSLGGNALADFYDTAGPHGELLAEGNAGVGERPLVEYTVGAGRVIFVGWRLPDFTTKGDPYRPNLERLFANLLRYLSSCNTNHARLIPPPGAYVYKRLLGVPFLQAAKPVAFEAPVTGEKCAALLTTESGLKDSFVSGGFFVRELPLTAEPVKAQALGLTLLKRERPVSQFVAARRAEQEASDKRDRDLTQGLKIIKPKVELLKAPLQPMRLPEVEQSVLLGRSPFMAPGDGKGDIKSEGSVLGPVYEPIEDGGFRIVGSQRRFNRPIVHGRNRVWTGDAPLFRMDTVTGCGCYSEDRVFPLWPRPDAYRGNTYPCMGVLRLGVRETNGTTLWLDDVKTVVRPVWVATTFRPGYTEYELTGPQGRWKATMVVAPTLDFNGMVCRVEFDKPVPLTWQYGGIWWQASESNANHVAISGHEARITEPNLPNGLALAGWDGEGEGRVIVASYGQQAEFTSTNPQRTYHLVAMWGVTSYDEERARKTVARLDTPSTARWPTGRDRLKDLWLDCYIRRALDPEQHFRKLISSPEEVLNATREWWDRRRLQFQIHTPDAHLNALINWNRCISEYHRQGPGLVLGAHYWDMYSHISTGWYGKQWGGDHEAIADCLRLYGAMQSEDGFIRWVSPSLVGFNAENNTPYWVDQVWWHYAWTGDRQFVHDLWPVVRQAVEWQRKTNDPDGDGLFQDWYEYWNCDSNGKGPKAAAPSAMSWAMLDRASKLAAVVGNAKDEREYHALAEKTRRAIFRELWREAAGRLGSIGADGLWRGHPQTWEEYLAINAGLLGPQQGRRAMRWLASHYGFEPAPGVHLLACSDWWPIRWSCQWVPTGDTCLAALAGMKCGDVNLWWPYLKTVVLSAFQSDFPGVNMGISNAGAGGGDREDVDSDDPHTHAAVRGLFGIEPALHEGRLNICPAFPSDWKDASIRTPDVSYEYRREGKRVILRIHTPNPVAKHVRLSAAGPEVVTRSEKDSVVRLPIPSSPSPPKPALHSSTILAEQQPPTEVDIGKPLTNDESKRQVVFDLSEARNRTVEELVATRFIYDYADNPSPVQGWWGNPGLAMPPSPRAIRANNGVVFLTAGRARPGLGETAKDLLALSSWPPYPLPAGATIAVGLHCSRLWLLLQSYVHPMKNYVPNGEVVLRFADSKEEVQSLIPPFNLDCYFQHFSRKGIPVSFGHLPDPGSFVHPGMSQAHADALEIPCDPRRLLESVQLRATCSEGVLGLAAMTAVTDE